MLVVLAFLLLYFRAGSLRHLGLGSHNNGKNVMEQETTGSKANAMRGLAALKQATAALANKQQAQEQEPVQPSGSGLVDVGKPDVPLFANSVLAHRGNTKKIPDPSELRLPAAGQTDVDSDGEQPEPHPVPPLSERKTTAEGVGMAVDAIRSSPSKSTTPQSREPDLWEGSPLNRFLEQKIKTGGDSGQPVIRVTENTQPVADRLRQPSGPNQAAQTNDPVPNPTKVGPRTDGPLANRNVTTTRQQTPAAPITRKAVADTGQHRRQLGRDAIPPPVPTLPPTSAPTTPQVRVPEGGKTHKDAGGPSSLPVTTSKPTVPPAISTPGTSPGWLGVLAAGGRRPRVIPMDPSSAPGEPTLTRQDVRRKRSKDIKDVPFETAVTPKGHAQEARVAAGSGRMPTDEKGDTRPAATIVRKGQVATAATMPLSASESGKTSLKAVVRKPDNPPPKKDPKSGTLLPPSSSQGGSDASFRSSPNVAAPPMLRPPTSARQKEGQHPPGAKKTEERNPTKPLAGSVPYREATIPEIATNSTGPSAAPTQAHISPEGLQRGEPQVESPAPETTAAKNTPAEPGNFSAPSQVNHPAAAPQDSVGAKTQELRSVKEKPATDPPKTGIESAASNPVATKRPGRLVVTIPPRDNRPGTQAGGTRAESDLLPRARITMSARTSGKQSSSGQQVHHIPKPVNRPGAGHADLEAVPSLGPSSGFQDVWQVPVENLGSGIAHLLGDAVSGILSLGQRFGDDQVSHTPNPKARISPSPGERRVVASRPRLSGMNVVTGRVTGGVRGVITGVAQIAGGSIDIVLGALGTLGGVIVHTAGRIGAGSKR